MASSQLFLLSFSSGMHGPPGPGTDRSESIRDFQNFGGPGAVRDLEIFLGPGALRSQPELPGFENFPVLLPRPNRSNRD